MDRDDGYAIRLRIFYRICQQIQKYTFRYPLLKLIVSSSEKSTLIIAFELLIIEFMERSTSSKIVLNLILQYGIDCVFFF
jgi:hypothetical protein